MQKKIIHVTKKQQLYAFEYFTSHDPLKAYVKAGYVSSEEEAKKKKIYRSPLKSQAVQQCLKLYKKDHVYYKTTLLYQQQQLFLENLKNYDDPTSPSGMDIPKLLRDIIYNP